MPCYPNSFTWLQTISHYVHTTAPIMTLYMLLVHTAHSQSVSSVTNLWPSRDNPGHFGGIFCGPSGSHRQGPKPLSPRLRGMRGAWLSATHFMNAGLGKASEGLGLPRVDFRLRRAMRAWKPEIKARKPGAVKSVGESLLNPKGCCWPQNHSKLAQFT